MADAVGVELGAQALRDHVHAVVLEGLGDPRHEGAPHREQEQEGDAAHELAGRVLVEAGRVAVDEVAEDERVEEREHLVHGGEEEGCGDEAARAAEVGEEEAHRSSVGRSSPASSRPS